MTHPNGPLPTRVVRWLVVLAVTVLIALLTVLMVSSTMDRIGELGKGTVSISVPAYVPLPQGQMDPTFVTVTSERATVLVEQLTDPAIAYFWGAAVVTMACCATVALTCVLLCYRLARGIPFGALPRWVTTGTGVLLVLGGMAVAVLEGYGKYHTVHALPGVVSVNNSIGLGSLDLYIGDSLHPLFFLGGLALLLLAAVLSRGTVHYRDVKDLV